MLSSGVIERIAAEVSAKPDQVSRTIALYDNGCTIPFVARYRKDVTGSLDEVKLETIAERNHFFISLEQRREAILQNIEKQDKLTDELRARIAQCFDKHELEDLYLPFKRKRRTKASVAREQGLEPLADFIWAQEAGGAALEERLKDFLQSDKGVSTAEQALEGALYILAERISEDAAVRTKIRERLLKEGKITSLTTKLSEGKKTKFSAYYDFSEPIHKIASHRLLAIMRGVKEGMLRFELQFDDKAMIAELIEGCLKQSGGPFEAAVRTVVEDAYRRLIRPSVENEVIGIIRRSADEHAVAVFRENAKNLLMSPPAGGIGVMGVDPGLRTGSKIAVIDTTGALTEHVTIFPDESEEKRAEAETTVLGLLGKGTIGAIAIGNGTGSREISRFFREVLKKCPENGPFIVLVSEAGASVYSASKLAREEFPDLDILIRGAVSIARRLQDPLAELVKIEPRSIGVGQYQHDVNQKLLREGLHQTVVSSVSQIGVDLNTASVPLLRYVSGMQYGTAQNIVAFRNEKGRFTSRAQLHEIPGVGPKVFEQCVGFLRIQDGENPLDSTAIHPEAYPIVEGIAESSGIRVEELIRDRERIEAIDFSAFETDTFGAVSMSDIRAELLRPGRDPRKRFRAPKFLEGVEDVKDLEKGMEVEGVVTNVTDFGAFVDIGVHQDGLVHLSELANRFVRDPSEVARVGDIVKVKVLEIDPELLRISLSIKALLPERKRRPARRRGTDEPAVVEKRPESAGETRRSARPGTAGETKRSARPGTADKPRRRKKERGETAKAGARRGQPKKGMPKVHETGENEQMNTQLAEQLAALREQFSD